jgi:hypothetical protein
MKNFSNISIDTSGFGPATPVSFNSFSGNTGLTPISISFNSGTINANTFAGNGAPTVTDNRIPGNVPGTTVTGFAGQIYTFP